MKPGDIVKYSNPVSESEAGLRFILLGPPEKGKVDIQLICDWRIKPIETVSEDDISLADDKA